VKEINILYRLNIKEKEVVNVKKSLIAFLFVVMMVMSLTVPTMAVGSVVAEPIDATTQQEIAPATEMTQIYWRTYHGQLQFRVWSITYGRWLTDWINF